MRIVGRRPPPLAATNEASALADAWSAELGAHWARWIPVGALLLFALGAAAPLADPDFPMHLATGAWIVHHHAVPFVEPFAWTRWGAPYYAYSWLPEVIYYQLYTHVGPLGVRALHGLTFSAGGASLLWMARVAGWRVWTALYLIFLSILPTILVAAYVRPQALLFPLVILAWGCGIRILDSDRPALWMAALALVAAASANSHLLFPLTALPCAIAISRTPTPWRRGGLMAAAVLAGWLASPYGLHWAAIFRLNFGHNAMLDFPSRVLEFTPGFQFARRSPICLTLVVLMAMVPWTLRDLDATPRERFVLGSLWFVGLFGFGLAGRALLVWWFAGLPALARVMDRVSPPPRGAQRRMALAVMAMLPLVLSVAFLRRTETTGADLSSTPRWSVEPLASWLDEHARPIGKPRVLTAFDYGSYLTWRLTAYSMSIDGRGIFPDSAAAPDAYWAADDGPLPLGPWQSSDLAIVPLHFPVATVLDTANGWVRVDTVPKGPRVALAVGLWVRRSWLERVRR